jgi:hypothetical protein
MTNIQQYIDLYQKGYSYSQIATLLDKDRSTVRKQLKKHYPGFKQSGRTLSALERFHKNVYPEPNTGCWLWGGTPGKHSRYGSISIKGRDTPAHIFSYVLHKGEIPKGLCVCHTCDIGFCVNPDHLFLGTHQDNMLDKLKKGRQPKGSEIKSSKLNEEQVIDLRKRYRSNSGFNQSEEALKIGCHSSTISRVVRGKKWKHLEQETMPEQARSVCAVGAME